MLRVSPSYSTLTRSPISGKTLPISTPCFDDTDDEGFDDGSLESIDPACIVMPASTKAHSGVSKYKDFVRFLPVHLAKNILGFLDQSSLHNCICVSKNWRSLAEEVHKEFFVNQHLREDVMLMQVRKFIID